MFVERQGRGEEAYLALHGWGGDRRTFAPLAPFVPEGASLYCADLPGCGHSPPPREWSPEAVVEEVIESARSVAPGRVSLVGNCGGAVFALLAAKRLGRRVGRVTMIDPFAYLPRYFRLFLAGEFGRRAYHATFATPLGRWLTKQALSPVREGGGDLTASFAGADHESARRYLALFDEIGGVEIFRGADVPVEILYGEKTFGAVRRSLALWREVLPQALFRELKGAGHLPIEEATAGVAEAVFGTSAVASGDAAARAAGGGK
ncbi:MAG TPA: alpha/beta hydrolase [Pyrinomonadaceae bacterium]